MQLVRRLLRIDAAVALTAVLALLAACAPPAPTPTELLEKTAQKVATASSVRFTLVRVGDPIVLDRAAGLSFTEATGDLAAPNRVRAKLKVISPVGAVTVEALWIPEGVYVSNPFTGAFTPLPTRPGFDPSALLGADGVPGILRSITRNASIVGKEKIAAVEAHHIRAEADGAKISALTGGVVVSGTHTVDVWIDVATSLLIRLTATEPGGVASWRLDLSDYDKPVEIGKP